MTNLINDLSLRKAAIIAGLGLLIMAILAPFANFFVLQSLIVHGDVAKTANNIMANQVLLRFGIVSLLIVVICDVVVAWALYVFLKPVNKSLSLLAGWFRLVYATIFGVSLSHLVNVFGLLNGSDYLKVFEINQLHSQVMLSLNAFGEGWNIALVIFSLHLLALGYLVFRSDFIPKFLGILLIITGIGYLIDTLGKFLLPNCNLNISIVTGWGELIFMFWLLIKGSKIRESN